MVPLIQTSEVLETSEVSSLTLAGGVVPILTQIWQPRTPAGLAFDVGVVASAKWTLCSRRLGCSMRPTGAVVGTATGVLVVSAMVMPMACFDQPKIGQVGVHGKDPEVGRVRVEIPIRRRKKVRHHRAHL